MAIVLFLFQEILHFGEGERTLIDHLNTVFMFKYVSVTGICRI